VAITEARRSRIIGCPPDRFSVSRADCVQHPDDHRPNKWIKKFGGNDGDEDHPEQRATVSPQSS
jgi:hypothetical protein